MPLFGLFSPPNVEKLKAKGDVEGLIKALSYEKDAWIRQAAAGALGQIGDARAVEPLLTILKDKDASVRRMAAKALGQIGDARAVEPLFLALKDQNSDVGKAAAEALGQIGNAQAVKALVTARGHRYGNVSFQLVISEELVKIGSAAVEPLAAALKYEPSPVRVEATKALRWIGDAQAVKPLIAALKDEDKNVRLAVVEALSTIRDAQAVEPLIVMLKDESFMVRKEALRALHLFGWQPSDDGQRALQAIINKDWESLVGLGAAATEPLLDAFKDINFNMEEVFKALDSLGWQPLDDKQRALQAVILQKWKEATAMGAEAVSPLLATLVRAWTSGDYTSVRQGEAAAKTLKQIGVPAVESLIGALEERHPDVRRVVVETLAQIGDARAAKPLIAALNDEHYSVQRAAVQALGSFDWPPMDAVQQALWAVVHKQWDTVVRLKAVAVEPLVMILQAGGDRVAEFEKVEPIYSEAAKALSIILEGAIAEVTTDNLRTIASLTTMVQIKSERNDCGVEWEITVTAVDYSQIRQLARQELIRRGLEA